MQERNVITGTAAAFTAPWVETWDRLWPFVLVALFLTLTDARWGIAAAKKRGEKIRKSRAIRRTINKVVDFICWISLTWGLGHTILSDESLHLIIFAIIAIVYGVELSSVFDNYFEYKGKKKRLNLWKLVCKLMGKPDLSDVIEDKNDSQE